MKIRNGCLSHKVLQIFESAANDGLFETFSYSAQISYLKSKAGLTNSGKSNLTRTITKLINAGLLEFENDKDGERILKLSKVKMDFNKSWDGKYRVVIWDIPENKRSLRDLLRRKLKEWKFVTIQKSVWVTKRNVTEQIRSLIKELEMEKWVTVIETDDPTLSVINFHDRGS